MRKAFVLVIVCLMAPTASAAGPLRRVFGGGGGFPGGASHSALVSQSGIRPHQMGTHEGVGVSSVSYEAARNKACYWGQRTPVSIQYSKQGSMYYAVVRYN